MDIHLIIAAAIGALIGAPFGCWIALKVIQRGIHEAIGRGLGW